MDDYRIRVRIFTGIIVVILSILVLRLVQLQIVDQEEYLGESRNNAIREQRVQPARGAIYDRNERLMVDNEPSYTVMITPRYFEEERVGLLAELLAVPDSLVQARLEEARRWSAFRPSRAFREVPFDVLSRLRENQYQLPGVTFEVEAERRYRTKARAAHALGYVREITERELAEQRADGYRQGDLVGKAGLEKNYERYLRGRVGSAFKLVNVRGLEVSPYRDGEEDTAPISGYDLYTGLDARVQALAESLFVNKRGAAVALDPRNGEIIAMVSAPDFDPEVFSQSIDPETWRYLTQSPEKPMFNRATMSGFPPGSTWKPFMSLMALQSRTISESTTIYCPGGYRLGGRVFSDYAGHAHGNVAVKEAIQRSCNTFYFALMMRTDVNTWARWAHRFGFGQRIPMDVREQQPGIIADSAYFNHHFPRGWTAGYSINLGIGQGNMSTTPMQLARYTAALANKGTLHPPHLVSKLVNPETGEVIYPMLPEPEEIPVEEQHFDVVREGMRLVMENGTGVASQIPGVSSAGKTGTSENPHGEDHSIFIMFAPFDDPQIALAVAVENIGTGAQAAAPIASLMAEQYLKGEIEDTYRARLRFDRVMSRTSEPIEQ